MKFKSHNQSALIDSEITINNVTSVFILLYNYQDFKEIFTIHKINQVNSLFGGCRNRSKIVIKVIFCNLDVLSSKYWVINMPNIFLSKAIQILVRRNSMVVYGYQIHIFVQNEIL